MIPSCEDRRYSTSVLHEMGSSVTDPGGKIRHQSIGYRKCLHAVRAQRACVPQGCGLPWRSFCPRSRELSIASLFPEDFTTGLSGPRTHLWHVAGEQVHRLAASKVSAKGCIMLQSIAGAVNLHWQPRDELRWVACGQRIPHLHAGCQNLPGLLRLLPPPELHQKCSCKGLMQRHMMTVSDRQGWRPLQEPSI